ncbi:MAG: putative lipid II flippase FtsW [Actinobacteria bacterium]|nr:putative lipid II flippase FtsW [Actinomycetota bacterium]
MIEKSMPVAQPSSTLMRERPRSKGSAIKKHQPGRLGSTMNQRHLAASKQSQGPSVGTDKRLPGRLGSGSTTRRALLAVTAILCGLGLLMVLSASSVTSVLAGASPWKVFMFQCLWVCFGALGLAIAAKVDYHFWRKFRVLLPAVTIALLVAVLLPHIGTTVGGSSRWLGFGIVRLQPSELAKLAMVLFGADLLARRGDKSMQVTTTVRPMLFMLAVMGVLVMKQPDMGTTLVLGCIAFGLLFTAGVPMRSLAKILALLAVAATLAAVMDPYRRDRLLSFIDPWAHASGSGYQVVQSVIGMGSGGLFGLGLGAGHEKWNLLPNAHTDFIFSVIGQETGLIGCLLVLVLFGLFVWLGIRTAARAPDRFGTFMASGITCWLLAQAVINIGAVVGLLPVTGIPLPFISYGGSSLVIDMAATGILVNIAGKERRRSPRKNLRGEPR